MSSGDNNKLRRFDRETERLKDVPSLERDEPIIACSIWLIPPEFIHRLEEGLHVFPGNVRLKCVGGGDEEAPSFPKHLDDIPNRVLRLRWCAKGHGGLGSHASPEREPVSPAGPG